MGYGRSGLSILQCNTESWLGECFVRVALVFSCNVLSDRPIISVQIYNHRHIAMPNRFSSSRVYDP